jgi:hypothetical protein
VQKRGLIRQENWNMNSIPAVKEFSSLPNIQSQYYIPEDSWDGGV